VRVHLYALCLDEADMLGFFFRHYDPWVERYVIFDDGSTDGSVELLDAHPRVERRPFERSPGSSFVLAHQGMQDAAWKESRGEADWVVITAIDEHLWFPGERTVDMLARYAEDGVTAAPALGYQMLSDEFPGRDELLCETRTIGAPFSAMNKLSLFRPDAIAETNFSPGRHSAAPTGDIVYPLRDELLLLHYRFLGLERFMRRQAFLGPRIAEIDRTSFGCDYDRGESEIRADWEQFAADAVDVSAPSLDPSANAKGPRWWRKGTRGARFVRRVLGLYAAARLRATRRPSPAG
jgi:glycosyl transferase family 2